MPRPIYLDYNATTPVDPAVLDAMLPYLREECGNASSAHAYGFAAHEAVAKARASVAALIGASPGEIVFTGGGSESNNLALKGVVLSRLQPGAHVVTSAVDHPAVLQTLAYLALRFGVELTIVPMDETGQVDVGAVAEAIRPDTILVTIMHANNETGTLQPITEISRVTRERGILFHVDAAQSAGKIPVAVSELQVDLLTIAGHKMYAPKGIGALYVRSGVALDPLVHGSGQEGGLRAGTENVAGIVAIGAASEIASRRLAAEQVRVAELRDLLHARLSSEIPSLALNGHPTERLPNTLNVSFPDVLGSTVLAFAADVAASTGSACHSGQIDPSPVLTAMGLPRERALGAVRLSLGHPTTQVEVEQAATSLIRAHRDAMSLTARGATPSAT